VFGRQFAAPRERWALGALGTRDVQESEKKVRILRALIRDEPGYLGRLATAIGQAGANIGDITKLRVAGQYNVRELELYLDSERHLERVLEEVRRLEGIEIDAVYDPVLEVHRGGKLRMRSTVPVERLSDVRKVYTPGVAAVCQEIQREPELVYRYTSLGHTVAIVTNGTAVLGLGNIGVHAGLPVMEGKAVLFDRLVGISGVPILIPTREVQTFCDTVVQIAPSFGAIQLEDIAAPECFEIEARLCAELPIPVMHDDQHGTAVVVLAALLNAARAIDVQIEGLVVGLVGLGAAGLGIARLLHAYGVKELCGTDLRRDAVRRLEEIGGRGAGLEEVMERSTAVVAITGRPGLIPAEWIRPGQIVFALSNPSPEISPARALQAGAAFAADGRSLNNALGYPGIFKGALAARARTIDDTMKIAAARTIAQYAEPGELVPALLDRDVHQAVADAVEQAAREASPPPLPAPPERVVPSE
jgi:malate dehydrogenase (oxaloacetate-decarboxylating)